MQQRPMSRRRTVSTVLAAAGLVVTGLTAAEPANAAQPSISISSTNSYPGSPARVVVRAVDGSGHAIRGAKVMVTYPGQGGQRVYTNTSGQAVANFTQRAGISAYHVYVWLPGSSSVSTQASLRSQGVRPHFPRNTAPLLWRAGAFSVRTTSGVQSSASAGLTLQQSDSVTSSLISAAAKSGASLIDAQLSSLIYNTLCNMATRKCHAATNADLSHIAASTRQIAVGEKNASAVASWQILDDYMWVSFKPAMNTIQHTLVSLAKARYISSKPTTCAFSLHLARRGDASDAAASLTAFRRTLTNYDAHWCNVIFMYSYPPQKRTYVPSSAYDWTMESILPEALADLRHAGWNPGIVPLVASPATFGFNPRKTARGPSYQPAPSQSELRQEVDAYCGLGASSVVGYAWQDSSTGAVAELWNSPRMQQDLVGAVNNCKSLYWR